ncbi:hypothetical protein O6H91_08G074000 [Diphasiastrum complanatum]|uniref:Uncharacterized protein n=1 Tax=Diphasiastrum complanatum TaxID=34168 RepID=A0ACC2CYZ8_DIPCM|nr:hypothetical protein O6H91_08G074000 [Diphasiastrum complanatum]
MALIIGTNDGRDATPIKICSGIMANNRVALVSSRDHLKGIRLWLVKGWADNFIAGGTASVLSKVILQPFDTTKTLLQASKEVRGNYSNLRQCMAGLVKEKGVGGLYTGFIASLAVSAPSSAVFAACYELSKNVIEKAALSPQLHLAPLRQCAPILAASFGNIVASIVRVPPEVIKQRVQAGLHRNVFHATQSVWKEGGLRGFYCGYSSMVLRDIPYSVLQFTTFEFLKRRFRHTQQVYQDQESGKIIKTQKILVSDIWMGAVAGAVASILTTPLDVIKTRLMTQQISGGMPYAGFRSTFKQIWLEEGYLGFGRGMLPRVLYKVPASALFLVCYEAMKRILHSARKPQ